MVEAGKILPGHSRLSNMLEKTDGLCHLRNYSIGEVVLSWEYLYFTNKLYYLNVLDVKHSGIDAFINVKVDKTKTHKNH